MVPRQRGTPAPRSRKKAGVPPANAPRRRPRHSRGEERQKRRMKTCRSSDLQRFFLAAALQSVLAPTCAGVWFACGALRLLRCGNARVPLRLRPRGVLVDCWQPGASLGVPQKNAPRGPGSTRTTSHRFFLSARLGLRFGLAADRSPASLRPPSPLSAPRSPRVRLEMEAGSFPALERLPSGAIELCRRGVAAMSNLSPLTGLSGPVSFPALLQIRPRRKSCPRLAMALSTDRSSACRRPPGRRGLRRDARRGARNRDQ